MRTFILAIPPAVWLLVSAAFFAAGEYLSKKWAMRPSCGITLQVMIVYTFATLAWLPALFHKNQLAVMGTAWLLLATIATVLTGIWLFDEPLSLRQWSGVGLSLVAMVLLCW